MAKHVPSYHHEVGVIVVGDLKSGKSTLIERFIHGHVASSAYKPTSFDKFYASKQVGHDLGVNFTIWDTSGAPAYDSVRPLAYTEADVFLVCFSVVEPISLVNVKSHWLQEIRKHRPDAPVVLCGCMASLRTDPTTLSHLRRTGRSPVTLDQAMAICAQIGVSVYVDTSAGENGSEVEEAFDMCARLGLQAKADSHRLDRPGSAQGGATARSVARPGSSASAHSSHVSGAHGWQSNGNLKKSSLVSSSSIHGSHSSIPGSSRNMSLAVGEISSPNSELDLHHNHTTAPVHRYMRSIDSSAGATILENEVFDSSSQGTKSPRSLHKLMRPLSPLARPTSPLARSSGGSPPHSPLARKGSSLVSSSLPTSPARSNAAGDVRSAPFTPVSPLDACRQPVAVDISGGGGFSSSSVSPLHSRSASQPVVVQFMSHVSSSLDSTEPESSSSSSGGAVPKTVADCERTRRHGDSAAPPPPVLPSRAVSPPPRPSKAVQSASGGVSSGPSLVKAVSHNSHIFKQFSQGSIPMVGPPSPSEISATPLHGSPSGASGDGLDLRSQRPERNSQLSRKTSFRASLPAGKPPLPAPLPKSPSDLAAHSPTTASAFTALTQEPLPRNPRFAQLGVPDPKSYESLKSHTSTASHGSTGSKLSVASSQVSGGAHQFYLGPRDLDIPDTEDPELLKKLDFVSPKAGVYRPVHVNKGGGKKDKCSLM